MDDIATEAPTRSQLIAELGAELGMPVVTVASGWCGNNLVNLDEEAARAFVDVIDGELDAAKGQGGEPADEVALFLLGRGGFVGFADAAWRALAGRGLAATVIVPYHVDGVFSLLALGAQRRLMHPYGALGAYDRRPLGRHKPRLDVGLVDGLDGLSERGVELDQAVDVAFERRQAELAHQLMKRMLGGVESGVGARVERALRARSLGSQLALSAGEVERLGLQCTIADGDRAGIIWQLYEAYEVELEILQPPTPRYTESEVANEVEFAPAMGVTGALIEGATVQLTYELDTGSPDPDTNMLAGEWLW